MTKNYWGYLPLLCSTESYVDDGTNVLARFPVRIRSHRDIEVALIGSQKEVQLVRVMVKDFDEDSRFTEKENEVISHIFDHMLSILTMYYDPYVQVVQDNLGRLSMAIYSEFPSLNVRISTHVHNDFSVNSQNIIQSFCGTWQYRELIRLAADAQNPRLPVQYRYLSIYKALELLYKDGNKWSSDFQRIINCFQADYEAAAISRMSLKNFIHSMRDRCAHFHLGGSDQGIAGLTSKEAGKVLAVFPILEKILQLSIRNKLNDASVSSS